MNNEMQYNYIVASTGTKSDVSFNLGNVTYTEIRYTDDTKTEVEDVTLFFCDGKSIVIDDPPAIERILTRPHLHFKNRVFRYNLNEDAIDSMEQDISEWLASPPKEIITVAPITYGRNGQWVAVNIFYLEKLFEGGMA
jgi:hypothetical protein